MSKNELRDPLILVDDALDEEEDFCEWCGDYFPRSELTKERCFGLLCNQCWSYLSTMGEDLEEVQDAHYDGCIVDSVIRINEKCQEVVWENPSQAQVSRLIAKYGVDHFELNTLWLK